MRRQGAPMVPAADWVSCSQCGEGLDARAVGTARQVRGWVVVRSQGGANMVKWPEPLGLYLCPGCVDARDHGKSWDQLTLWEP